MPDRSVISANGQDLSFVRVEIQDGHGNRVTTADEMVEFKLEGPGKILAVANSNPMSTESYQQPRRKAYQGRCLLVVQSELKTGEITLTAHSSELQSSSITIMSNR